MIIKNIHPSWGTIIEFDNPLNFFQNDFKFWRNMIYERKLIVFKKMNFSKQDYVKFCSHFGKIWSPQDYKYSFEVVELIDIGHRKFAISPISNKISNRLELQPMEWHSDIPNKKDNPFPHRALWMVNNPDPNSGLTTWLNLEEGLDKLSNNLKSDISKIQIIQQSWYIKGTDIQEFEFVKVHPITGKKSLRLNYFCVPEKNINDAWIKSVKFNEKLVNPKSILAPYYNFLEQQSDLLFTHQWDNFDIIIYDNWSFVHSRSKLQFDSNLERKFYRINIDHISENDVHKYCQILKYWLN